MNRVLSRALAVLLLQAATASAAGPGAGAPAGLTVDLGFINPDIVITAPRDRIPPERIIDPRINAILVRLLEQRSQLRPTDVPGQHEVATVFGQLTTLTGHTMSQRYTELGFLLTEGLAGTRDPSIQSSLERVARRAVNPQMRASALVSLAYAKDERFVSLFQETLRDPSLTVRLGAVESLIVSSSPAAQFLLADAAANDASFTVKVMAAAAYWERGNPAGREILLRLAEDADWYVRADAIYNLGRLGGADEYRKLMDFLSREKDPVVRAELTLALMRLEKFK